MLGITRMPQNTYAIEFDTVNNLFVHEAEPGLSFIAQIMPSPSDKKTCGLNIVFDKNGNETKVSPADGNPVFSHPEFPVYIVDLEALRNVTPNSK